MKIMSLNTQVYGGASYSRALYPPKDTAKCGEEQQQSANVLLYGIPITKAF